MQFASVFSLRQSTVRSFLAIQCPNSPGARSATLPTASSCSDRRSVPAASSSTAEAALCAVESCRRPCCAPNSTLGNRRPAVRPQGPGLRLPVVGSFAALLCVFACFGSGESEEFNAHRRDRGDGERADTRDRGSAGEAAGVRTAGDAVDLRLSIPRRARGAGLWRD